MPRLLLTVAALALFVDCQCSRGLEDEGLTATPSLIDFGTVPVGERRGATISLKNHTDAPLTIEGFQIDSAFGQPGPFVAEPLVGTARLEPSGSLTVRVSFAPTEAGQFGARAIVALSNQRAFAIVLEGAGALPAQSDGGDDGGAGGGQGDAGGGGGSGGGGGGSFSCSQATCGAPPAASCQSSSTLRTWTWTGTCTQGSCDYASQDSTCANGCAAGACQPCVKRTCVQVGAACGSPSDNCGGTLSCGTCATGTCGGAGVPFQCGSGCGASCTSWADCTNPGEGCDTSLGCCVPCGGANRPCCVDWNAGQFFCGSSTEVCGRATGSGTTTGYYCCQDRGDGCCQQGGCGSTGDCCKCPRNGLNFCVNPSFGCGGC